MSSHLETFPDIVPGIGSKNPDNTQVNKAAFGNGYVQKSGSGLNSQKDVWELVFDNIGVVRAAELKTFHRAQGCVTPFLWTPPLESVERQWIEIEDTFSTTPTGPTTATVTMTIEEDFTPVNP